MADFIKAFEAFTARLLPGGILLACSDDPGALRLLQQVAGRRGSTRSYGLDRSPVELQPNYCASELHQNEQGGMTFNVGLRGQLAAAKGASLKVHLKVPGRHNVLNALAVIGVAHLLELPLAAAADALGEFRGTSRRFELRGDVDGIQVIDDYAHHPSEIKATLAAARGRFPGRRIWAVWQPHTYSRVRLLLDDFAGAFTDADIVLVTEIYAAREAPPLDAFSARRVVEAMPRKDIYFAPDLAQATRFLVDGLRSGDVVLVLSAGDADQVSTDVLEQLSNRHTV